MDAHCRIELFGETRLLREDRVVSRFRTRKAAHLLACLALPPGRRHTREALADRFWPDLEPEAGRDNLSTELSGLRKALEPAGVQPGSVLVADRQSVRLNPAAVSTDVQECEELLRQVADTSDPLRRAELLERAVGLYQGELVPDCYDDWLLPEQRRWAERHVDALLAWARALEEEGDLERALEVAARAASADPLREEACACRLRVYASLGRFADARGCYREYVRRLNEESGAPPSPGLLHLAESLQSEARTPVGTETPPARLAGPPAPPIPLAALDSVMERRFPPLPLALDRLHGRLLELERLVEWLAPAREQENDDAMTRLGDDATGEGPGDAPLPSSHHRLIPSSSPSSFVHRPSSAGPRLVTITGPGGSGKTRLALEAAARASGAYGGRVAFVPLESVDDPARIASTAARALGLPRTQDADLLDVMAELLGSAPSLLVLDNFEQLLAGRGPEDARALLRQMLGLVPALRLLVTSRQALAVQGEQELRLAPLSTPSAAGVECESVALFVDRASGINPSFRLTAENTADVSALCERLEGSPLAIEMAAAWTRTLPPGALRERLEGGLTDLSDRRKDAPLRHRSLRAALEWSYDLLSPDLRRAFSAFSAFRGGWTLEAAEAVAGEEALELLTDLVERSLVVVEGQGGRYRYLETVREFARERLHEQGEEEACERHARHYLRQAEKTAAAAPVPRRAGWRDLGRDYPNLHAALEWLAQTGRSEELAQAVAMLERFWLDEGYHLRDGLAWTERALSLQLLPDGARAAALRAGGAIAFDLGRSELSRERYRDALALSRERADDSCTLASMLGLARGAAAGGDRAEASRLVGECTRILRALGDARAIADGLLFLVGVTALAGDQQEKERMLRDCESVARESGLFYQLTHALYGLASIARDRGDGEGARALWEECVALDEQEGVRGGGALWALGMLAEERGDRAEAARVYGRYLRESLEAPSTTGLAEGLYGLAVRALRCDEPDRAARLLGAALRQTNAIDVQFRPERRKDLDALIARLREPLGRERCDALLQEGWQMEPEAAIELGLGYLKA